MSSPPIVLKEMEMKIVRFPTARRFQFPDKMCELGREDEM